MGRAGAVVLNLDRAPQQAWLSDLTERPIQIIPTQRQADQVLLQAFRIRYASPGHKMMSGPTDATFSSGLGLAEVTERLSKLYSAVVCDALDSLGFRRQALSHRTRPVSPSSKLIGSARTLASYPVDRFPDQPYAKELEALDTLVEGDVVVLATNGDVTAAVWGELLSIAAFREGSAWRGSRWTYTRRFPD